MNFLLQSVLDIQTDSMGGNIVSKYEYGNARPISGWTCSHCNYKTDYIHKLEEHQERSHAADTMQEDDYVEAMFHCAHCDYKSNEPISNARPLSGWGCSHCNYKADCLHKLEEHEERSHAAHTMQEDDYVEAMFHCAHCDYKTNDRFQLSAHMEISHTQDEVLAESKIEEEMADAIEVWKIYKLLRRMKNK